MPVLADYGLVGKIGPADESGLYEITAKGRAAMRCRDQYDDVDDFGHLVESELGSEQTPVHTHDD